jgi:hypothetical protein
MLPRSKLKGSEGFTSCLAVANMRLSACQRVGILYVQSLSRPFFFYYSTKRTTIGSVSEKNPSETVW